METLKMYRNDVSIPVVETTSAFARGVTLTEAFRLWQLHDHAQQNKRKGGAMATKNVSSNTPCPEPQLMRYCA